MIHTGRFCEFVDAFCQTVHDEKNEDTSWQYFLHKVFEGSYADFKAELKTNSENQNMSVRAIETTIKHSMDILRYFSPEEGGET